MRPMPLQNRRISEKSKQDIRRHSIPYCAAFFIVQMKIAAETEFPQPVL